MQNQNLTSKIIDLKNQLRKKVVIPVHHYQSADISQFADFLGDSYKLAVDCSNTHAEFVVFCGVLFMAECADILRKPHQKVVIPAKHAGCPMADMANIFKVEEVFLKVQEKSAKKVIPIVYMNSYADLKAFCGEKDGSVCTSSNAHLIIDYYIKKDCNILFFPDEHLGRNTATKMGFSSSDIITTDTIDSYSDETFILWKGFCPIHQKFNSGDVDALRKKYEDITIIVHPECDESVAKKSDLMGSTEFILKTISDSAPGTSWGVGTETVFVDKLAEMYPNKKIFPLKKSECANMKKTELHLLADSLQNIKDCIDSGGEIALINQIVVNPLFKESAAKSLRKMIEIVEP